LPPRYTTNATHEVVQIEDGPDDEVDDGIDVDFTPSSSKNTSKEEYNTLKIPLNAMF